MLHLKQFTTAKFILPKSGGSLSGGTPLARRTERAGGDAADFLGTKVYFSVFFYFIYFNWDTLNFIFCKMLFNIKQS